MGKPLGYGDLLPSAVSHTYNHNKHDNNNNNNHKNNNQCIYIYIYICIYIYITTTTTTTTNNNNTESPWLCAASPPRRAAGCSSPRPTILCYIVKAMLYIISINI